MQRGRKFFAQKGSSLEHSKRCLTSKAYEPLNPCQRLPQGAAAAEAIGEQMLKAATNVSPASL